MTQITLNSDSIEVDTLNVEAVDFQFLEESTYEFVGGGDAANGY